MKAERRATLVLKDDQGRTLVEVPEGIADPEQARELLELARRQAGAEDKLDQALSVIRTL
jgi:hypothetical protein